MFSQYLALPADEEHRRQIELHDLECRIKNPREEHLHDPRAWFFPSKDTVTWETITWDTLSSMSPKTAEHCVYGYYGTAPIMIVGVKPSTHVEFHDEHAKTYYRLLERHGFQNAHLTDSIKTGPRKALRNVDEKIQLELFKEDLRIGQRQEAIFKEELRIIKPLFVLAFNDADEIVKGYLEGFGGFLHVRPLPVYKHLMYTDKLDWWESELIDRRTGMRTWAEVHLEYDEAKGRYRRRAPIAGKV